jgi:hypothetical protein
LSHQNNNDRPDGKTHNFKWKYYGKEEWK